MKSHISVFSDFTVGLFEKTSLEQNPKPLAEYLGADVEKVCFAKAASKQSSPGFQMIRKASFGSLQCREPDLETDGVILKEPGSSVIFRSGDCPIVTIFEQQTRCAVIVHCGRPALTPILYKHGFRKNILNVAREKIQFVTPNPKVRVHISGSICPAHFAHETEEGQALVKSFDYFGLDVFTDRAAGKLDMVKLISKQIHRLFNDVVEITHDKFCTYETPWLASHRRHPTEQLRSPVVVVLH